MMDNNQKETGPGGTLRQALKWGQEQLEAAGVPDAALDAWYLLSEASGVSRAVFFMDRDRPWQQAEARERYRQMIKVRAARTPLQYITGSQEFMGFAFLVTPAVLIPRQDTETLVEYALSRLRPGDKVLDMCTGSGCIGISLALLKGVQVQCSDYSGEALAVARENGRRLGCQEIRWVQGDLFENITDRDFDMIVSNPPYIATAQIRELMPEVRDHEPLSALDGDADGLSFYRRLAADCVGYLKPGGQVCFEIGWDQARAVSGLLKSAGFTEIQILKDAAGLDRAAAARL